VPEAPQVPLVPRGEEALEVEMVEMVVIIALHRALSVYICHKSDNEKKFKRL
jgi:hypothetical protein